MPPASSLSLTFEFQEKYTASFGNIPRPVAQVNFFNEVQRSWKNVTLMIDTGADITLLPSYIAVWLDIDLGKLEKISTQGIGGSHHVFVKRDMRVKLGQWERQVPVGFIRDRYVPPLLGRHLFLETFVTTLEKNKKVTFRER